MENKQRHGNKRNSGIYDYNETSIQRRTSKKISSRDRHGQIYPDGFAEASIRAVTPEPAGRTGSETLDSTSDFSSTTTTTSSENAIRGGSNGQPRTHASMSSYRPNGFSGHRTPEALSRPRTRTLDGKVGDRSPTSLMSKTRNRISSLHTAAPAPLTNVGEDAPSIGFPSIIPSPPLPSQSQTTRQRLIKSAARPPSPIKNVHATTSTTPQSSPTTDTAKILQLMKITCGRMHGILSFRTTRSNAWSSGYCAINVATGSLIYQMKGDISHAKTLIPDLRGCKVRTMWDRESRLTYLDVYTHSSALGIHLRPHVPETFDSWLAALLCWQPIRPKGVQNKMTKPQATVLPERRPGDRKRNSAINTTKDAAIIKVGKMLYWDENSQKSHSTRYSSRRISTYKQQRSMSSAWQKVSCTLQENGHLKLFTESDTSLVTMIPLSSLSRYAIQRLEPSALDDEFCLAIYPRYTTSSANSPSMSTVYLSLESRVLYEVWFVLLRAFTVPDLYGPEQPAQSTTLSPVTSGKELQPPLDTDSFRVERVISLRIIEAKAHTPRGSAEFSTRASPRVGSSHSQDWVSGDYYAEVNLDGEIRARTMMKPDTSNPFWREDYEFLDMPPVLSTASVVLKTRNNEQRDWTLVSNGPYEYEHGDVNDLSVVGDIEISPADVTYGTIDLGFNDLERGKDTEKWWPIINDRVELVGEMLMKARIDEFVVLISQEYRPMSEILNSFSNGLTQQIIMAIPTELRKLSEILLNIFQVSAQASDWIMSLVEDEIDGIHKDTPVSRFRYSRRIASNDTYETGIERELILRDLGKSATVEANLLFRGNSLLTKALDLHMRRLGKEYLEETLSQRIRDIDESDPECEVDPNKVQHPEDLQRNWRNLIALTENIWKSIHVSASRCPPELRVIFRHIRACAEDRFGDFLRSVTYSSVSGFLFLRFFCPAVLNPKLFGLLKDHPRPRAQRTLTLIAKSLQTFANLNTFGSKEPWMAPMNAFLTTHRQEFKSFVDAICAISSDRTTSAIPPSYATPITILSRLPPMSREGFPSLPYLIDQAREFAALVALWTQSRDNTTLESCSSELNRFDAICEMLSTKTRECLAKAEAAERPSGVLEVKWQELIEQMSKKSRIASPPPLQTPEDQSPSGTPAIVRSSPPFRAGSSTTTNSSTASIPDSVGYYDPAGHTHRGDLDANADDMTPLSSNRPFAAANADLALSSSSAGFESTPPGSSSSVWDPGTSVSLSTHPLSTTLSHTPSNSTSTSTSTPSHLVTSGLVGRRRRLILVPSDSELAGMGRETGKEKEPEKDQEKDREGGGESENSSLYSVEATAGSALSRSPVSVKERERDRKGLGDVWGFRRRRGGIGERGRVREGQNEDEIGRGLKSDGRGMGSSFGR